MKKDDVKKGEYRKSIKQRRRGEGQVLQPALSLKGNFGKEEDIAPK